jgi:hypothetical protein
LITGQIRHQARLVARNRLLLFFTFALPLLLFFMFQIVIHDDIFIDGQHFTVPQFFGPSLAGYARHGYVLVPRRQHHVRVRKASPAVAQLPLPAWWHRAAWFRARDRSATSGLARHHGRVHDLHIALVAIRRSW